MINITSHTWCVFRTHCAFQRQHFVLFQNNNTGILIVLYVWNGMVLLSSEIDHLRWVHAHNRMMTQQTTANKAEKLKTRSQKRESKKNEWCLFLLLLFFCTRSLICKQIICIENEEENRVSENSFSRKVSSLIQMNYNAVFIVYVRLISSYLRETQSKGLLLIYAKVTKSHHK